MTASMASTSLLIQQHISYPSDTSQLASGEGGEEGGREGMKGAGG